MSACSNKRRAAGLAYPRTCSVCGLGPCRETTALNPPEPPTNTVKHTPDAREWKDKLWAVSVQGPDDLVPVASYIDACRAANAFNAWWQAYKTTNPMTENDPRMWARPVEWIGDAESHAWWIENPSPEYADFVDPAPQERG